MLDLTRSDISPSLKARAEKIKLLVLDVDGVLTDGRITYLADGQEIKSFYVQDGLGIKLLQQHGIAVGIISARESLVVAHRARELGIVHVFQAAKNKLESLSNLARKLNLNLEQICFVGDDLPDLAAITHCGLGVAVANAHPSLRSYAQWQTQNNGGAGAVREVCDLLLIAQGLWPEVFAAWQ